MRDLLNLEASFPYTCDHVICNECLPDAMQFSSCETCPTCRSPQSDSEPVVRTSSGRRVGRGAGGGGRRLATRA